MFVCLFVYLLFVLWGQRHRLPSLCVLLSLVCKFNCSLVSLNFPLFVFVLERPVKDIGCLLSCLGCMFVYFLCFFVCFCFCDQSKTSVAFSFIFVKTPLSSSPSLSLLDDFTEKYKKIKKITCSSQKEKI